MFRVDADWFRYGCHSPLTPYPVTWLASATSSCRRAGWRMLCRQVQKNMYKPHEVNDDRFGLHLDQSACIQCVESHSKILWIWVVGIYIGLDRLLTIQKLPVINGHSSHPADELEIRQVVLVTQTWVGVDLQGVVIPATFTRHSFKADLWTGFSMHDPFHRQSSSYYMVFVSKNK